MSRSDGAKGVTSVLPCGSIRCARTEKRLCHGLSATHEKFGEEMDKVNKWRKALAAAGNLSGWHISAANGGESLFINKIIQEISGDRQPCGGMEKNLIDIESRINELNSLLSTEATYEVRMVGICGMGGIGKTTIARALFRRISYKFEGSSFIKDVRENSKKDICALQQKILKDVLATQDEDAIEDPEDGAEMMQTRFCNKKVLLVLDDVDDVKQLEFLAATHEWFGAGSRIIITTRNEHLLSDTNARYKPAILLKQHAVELFSRHAFRKNNPPEGYEELSNRVIRYTGGLPLALKVLGSFFRKREASVWESALNRLAKTPNSEIFETLKISFDGLEASEKNIFLDIACFFKGHDEEHVTRVLDSFGFDPTIGISALTEKSLITISNERIDMHDVLQEMGLEIVRKSYPNSRLRQDEEIHDFFTKNRNLEAVEAIVSADVRVMCFSADVFEHMKNIRLLNIHRDFTSCEPTTLPDELRWLRWDDYPFFSLPVANLRKLVGLELSYGKNEHLWMGYKVLPYLKCIHLKNLYYLKKFPDVSGAPNVERLIFSHCESLVEVHKSLGTLRKLAYLNMSNCWELKYLPSMIGMQLLETIDLSDCRSLEIFPEVSSGMEKLSNIHLDGCSNLKIIPSSICELKSLKKLHLHDCMELPKLPELEKLEELQLGFRDPVKAFQRRRPNSIDFQALTKLSCLRKLDLSWRSIEDQDFLNNLDAFSSLEELHLSGDFKLVHLPASISRLSRLKLLELNQCQQLQTIQGLPSGIQVLKACDCGVLERIEDLTKEYVRLHKIFLPGCERLLENEENERHLDKMLQQSFLKKCVDVDRQLSIWIPGSKIPSWFKEQGGCAIALKLPPQWHRNIMGFMVCVVFEGKWRTTYGNNSIIYKSEDNGTVSIVYIPISVFWRQMYNAFDASEWDDLSLFDEGDCSISIISGLQAVRCGAHIVYKEDKEYIQQIETYSSDHGDSEDVVSGGDKFVYRIQFRVGSIDL